MFCHKCGTQLEDGAKFCHKCGTKMLSKEDIRIPPSESGVNNAAIRQSVENVSSKKKSKKSAILIGVTAMILIIAVAIVVTIRKANDDYAELSDSAKVTNENNSALQGEVRLTETFTDKKTGISFQYPAEWVILDSSSEYNIVEMLDSRNTADHIATFKVSETFDQDPYGVYTQDEASVRENVNEYCKFISLEDTMLGDVPAKVLKFRREGLNSDDIAIFFWYKIGEETYQVSCSCTASTIDIYEPIFEAIMNSYTVDTAMLEQSQEEIFGFETDYWEEYTYKVRELSAMDGSLQFALIDLIDNGVPELVADYPGYYVSVFTWGEEEVITLMDQWPYGAGGNMGYDYLPGQNVIRNYNMDYAGAVVYESYMKVNDNYEIVNIFDEEISIRYIRDTNNNGMIDEEDEYSEEPIYYCNDIEISEKEYVSYQISGDYEYIEGNMSAEAMLSLLLGDDEVIEDTLSDSDIYIEDYYRLSGLYSDTMGESYLSISIYSSHEEGDPAIGTVFLYMDDEEIYLGELILVEEGIYEVTLVTGDEMVLEETKGEGIILLVYGNEEYLDAYRMIEHYMP